MRTGSLRGKRPGRRLGATVQRRVREAVPWAAARPRNARTMLQHGPRGGLEAGRAAGEVTKGSPVAAQAAGTHRIRREERRASGGGRQTETKEGAAGERSERERGAGGNASTIGKGTCARSAEGRASASTIGKGAGARSAEGRASASTLGEGASARSAEGRASASMIG